jgi:hypothetical protein
MGNTKNGVKKDQNIMQEIIVKDKQKYLSDNYPFKDVPELTDEIRCIHCDTIFTVGDYKVFKDKDGDEFICCPKAPECDGTIIDWFGVESSPNGND